MTLTALWFCFWVLNAFPFFDLFEPPKTSWALGYWIRLSLDFCGVLIHLINANKPGEATFLVVFLILCFSFVHHMIS